jgi:exopolysaccharide biosynthesis polyprenyl glycosylphosphotransferase
MLLGADLIGLSAAFVVTELLFVGSQGPGHVSVAELSALFIFALPVWVLAAKFYGLYDRDEERTAHSTADEVVSVFHLVTVGVWLFFVTSWLIGWSGPRQAKLTTFWLLAFIGVIGMRAAARALARRQPAYIQNTVIVGAGDIGQLVARKLQQHPEYGLNFIGFVDATPKQMRPDLETTELLGAPEQIADIVERHDVDRVIVAFSGERHDETLRLVRALRAENAQIDIVPRLFETVSPSAALHTIEGLPVLSVAPVRIPRSSRMVKRSLDVVGASLLLALTAPLILVVALLIRRDSKGPVFFRQRRLGMDMREFTLFKFRTMRDGTDDGPHREYMKQIVSAHAAPSSNRLYKLERADAVTRVGQWLRRTSLDELPQLLNVVRGEMSLVGPRPAIGYELELYAPHHFDRFLVPAGLTGLWQVEARAHSTFGEALDLDAAYARSWSLGLDLRLLLRTPLLIFRKRETG